jgi:hypothetical protein
MQKWLVLLTIVFWASSVHGQTDGGQFWLRAFEDRDGDGIRDAGEPLVTRGVSVELIDVSGTVIASALLDQSPNATQGLVGFQYLAPGQYTLVASSADLTATTATQFTVSISAGALPTVVEFGGQRISAAPPSALQAAAQADAERAAWTRFAVAGLAALVVVGAMTLLGVVIYANIIRPRAYRAAHRDMIRAAQTATANLRAVNPDDLDRFKPQR